MKNLNQILKQAQEMQQRMADIQEKAAEIVVEGKSGGGMVVVTLSGKGDVRGVKIDPSLLNSEESDMLEDLIIAAFNDGKQKVDAQMATEMQKVTGGMALPGGMKLPF